MNYCPSCGALVEFARTENDVATTHTYWDCPRCGAEWEKTVSKETDKTLHISPVEGGRK